MLLPDSVHPEQTIYYNGAFILDALKGKSDLTISELYEKVRSAKDMSITIFTLSIDWLFLLNALIIDEDGRVKSCF